MVPRHRIKNPASWRGKKRVAREDHVVGIPPIRVRHRIRVDIPAAASIPVRVHGPLYCAQRHPYHHPSKACADLETESDAGPQSPPVLHTNSILFCTCIVTLGKGVPIPILNYAYTKVCPQAVAGGVRHFFFQNIKRRTLWHGQVSEGPSVQGPKVQGNQESAREDHAAGIPPIRVRHRKRADTPAAASTPVRVHGPPIAVYIFDIEDVGVAVGE